MKRVIVLLVALLVALPTMAMLPSNGYEEELGLRDKSQSQVKPQVELNVGFITGGKLLTRNFGKVNTNLSRPYLEVIGGARIGSYLFVGVGTGVQYLYGECNLVSSIAGLGGKGAPDTWGALTVPIYANVKGCFATRTIVTPYISLSIGGQVITTSNFSRQDYGKLRGGLYMKFGAGLTISKFNFGLGLASHSMEWIDDSGNTMFNAGNNAFYIEAGVAF